MSLLGHVEPDPHLRLDPELARVERYLRGCDASLRLRRSADHAEFYVLERRIEHGRPIHTETSALTDRLIQARDGYIHISDVHPAYVRQPELIIEQLRKAGGDLWSKRTGSESGAAVLDRELRAEEEAARQARHDRRVADYHAWAREAFDISDRLGDRDGTERTRINNAGGLTVIDRRRFLQPTGETPVEGATDVHQTDAPSGEQDRELRDHPAAG